MCGIAGIIDFNGRPVLQEELEKMTDAIAHRGPDGEGFFIDGVVGFGHRRLAIIDLSETAAQPMTRFGLTITYNGEIYNYIELRSELQKQGIVFTTQSDTEVILAAYHIWGKDCVQRFNGMWAMAIYDAANHEVFLSRDRFGEKPLYYTQFEGRFLFCSEIKGLLRLAPSIEPDPVSVALFLLYERGEFVSRTFFKNIASVTAGHSAIIHMASGKIAFHRYYFLPDYIHTPGTNTKAWLPLFEQYFNRAIQLRLRSDVAVGSCLSGGLDSSAIVAVASKLNKNNGAEKFHVVSAGALDKPADELHFARMVATFCDVQQTCVLPDLPMLERALQAAHWAQEAPLHSASPLLQWLLFETAAADGLKVMLDGQGADELCLGYQTHLAWAIQHGHVKRGLGALMQMRNHYQLSISAMLKLLCYDTSPALKSTVQRRRWPKLQATVQEGLLAESFGQSNAQTLPEMQVAELTQGTLPLLLRYEDKNAMAHGIETRLPFLDKELVEFLLSVKMSGKIHEGWSKYIIRQFVEMQLPQELAWRKGKVGFNPGSYNMSNGQESPALLHFLHDAVFRHPVQQQRIQHKGAEWRWQSLHLWYSTFFE